MYCCWSNSAVSAPRTKLALDQGRRSMPRARRDPVGVHDTPQALRNNLLWGIWRTLEEGDMSVLDKYRRYRQLLTAGAYQQLSEVVDDKWIDNCLGLTGWTLGLDMAAANFAAGIGRAFSELSAEEIDVLE